MNSKTNQLEDNNIILLKEKIEENVINSKNKKIRIDFLLEYSSKLGFRGKKREIFLRRFAHNNKHKTNLELSEKIKIEEPTLRKYLTKIYKKLEASGDLTFGNQERNKFEKVYKWLWNKEYYEWVKSKSHCLVERRKKIERRHNGINTERRRIENIRTRLITGFKIECVRKGWDYFQEIIDLRRITKAEKLKTILQESVKVYKFLNKSGNQCNYQQVINEAIEKVKMTLNETSLMNAIESIASFILKKYEVITDRRQNPDRRQFEVLSLSDYIANETNTVEIDGTVFHPNRLIG